MGCGGLRALLAVVSTLVLAGCSAVVSTPGAGALRSDGGADAADSGVVRPDGSACPPATILCGDVCAAPATDPNHCGGCGMACVVGQSCVSGSCACSPGDPACAGPPIGDPSDCGAGGSSCADDEVCALGMCRCRPGLSRVRGACVDLASDPNNCGMVGVRCDQRCAEGRCVDRCPPGLESCGDACVDLAADPLNCGGCGDSCDRDQLCADSNCEDYQTAPRCDSCPCGTCAGDFDLCCIFPGTEAPVCVDAPSCR